VVSRSNAPPRADEHVHAHVHGDGHGHGHGPLESYDHVQGGAPVIDIGGDIGALVATVDPETVGTELHLLSEHDPPVAVHTGVWNRRLGSTTVTAAVFAELVEGRYRVLDDAGRPVRTVTITGGELAQVDLRRSPTPGGTPESR
jgi:hypothetical protein